jgi:UDP-N-acetylmuramoyl-tripeptide--D-alanyl-D-alanine ligase
MRFRASEVASAIGGRLEGPDVVVEGVTIDSRSVPAAALFVPLVGARDGHEFIADARSAGAAAYLTARAPVGGTAIVVDDTGGALTALGRVARQRVTGPVVGVTGSVGKTSVKDLAAAALGSVRRVHANVRSFNNELGLPLTLANAPDDVEVVIVEMGARGVGHIADLCAVARPTIGVVTAVALVHSELFGTIDQVARTKGELIEALPPGGTAVLNADDPRVLAMAGRTPAPALTFGRSGSADVRVEDLAVDDLLRPRFTLRTPQGSAAVGLAVAGAHMAVNAAAAVAVGLAVGAPLDGLVEGLTAARLSPWRMEVDRAASGAVVINDAYNANPTSTRAALEALAAVPAGRRVAVLGAMAELGVEGPSEHDAVAREAVGRGVEVIAVACPAYGPSARHVADLDGAVDALGQLAPTDAVLVKGSRVAGLERLAGRLLGTPGPTAAPVYDPRP